VLRVDGGELAVRASRPAAFPVRGFISTKGKSVTYLLDEYMSLTMPEMVM